MRSDVWNNLTGKNSAWLYLGAVYIALCTEYAAFSLELGSLNVDGALLYGSIETAVMLLPFWFMRGRARVFLPIMAWLLSAFYFCSIAYFRYWGVLPSLSLCTQLANTDGLILESALPLLKAGDMLYLAVPIVSSGLWFSRSFRNKVIATKSVRLVYALDVALLTVLAFCGSVALRHRYGWFDASQPKGAAIGRIICKNLQPSAFSKADNYFYLINSGLPMYFSMHLLTVFQNRNICLTNQEKESLARYCITGDRLYPDSLSSAESRNLILIVVESLNSSLIGRSVNGVEITPTMNALVSDSTTLSCLRVRPQIRGGGSSDGQMMYQIGLLPTLKHVASTDFISRLDSLPALPRVIPGIANAYAIFGEDGKVWNESKTYEKYGYDEIWPTSRYVSREMKSRTRDGRLLEFALDRAAVIEQPFVMTLLTVQMHTPYNEPLPDFTGIKNSICSDRERRYVNCAADFDRQLGMFVKGLRERGLWDNTVLVIASDHNAPDSKRPDGSPSDIVFIAANAGRGERIEQEVHQIDVFPTVLDIMGVKGGWRGVGRSMLGPRRGSYDTRQAGVSDSLLRSDYFKAR